MITSIELGDFLSHEKTTIDLEDGVTIFVGKNGAGKSSIIDAITFSLFGKHTRKSNKGLIRRGNNQGSVKIKFSINIQMSHFTNIGSGKIWLEELEYIKNFIKNEIMIEITETQNTRLDEKVANREIQYLRDNGISVALDDYGVEGSNLERLINTPWNIIKLDKQLIDNVVTNKRSRVAVEGIKTMATRLNNQIIAEGVETKEQLKYLKKIGIDLIQGFLFSKPMPGNQIEGYIKQFSAKYN